MKTKLISITKPCIEGIDTAEDLISYCARVSNPENQFNTETAPRLLKYLIQHKHWSPMEMASMTVEIKTSRAIAAQILRHRSFSFQEFSQRYSSAAKIEKPVMRYQAKKNRQSSEDIAELPSSIKQKLSNHIQDGIILYTQLQEHGIAKECARMILPLCTETTLYMTGNIRSWVHYLELRTQQDTQLEHRVVADEIKQIFIANFPVISEALEWL
jgi:thymidylate synthase (FAD)